MTSLPEILTAASTRPEAVKALSSLVETEVSAKSGLSGAALKTAFAAATKMRPGLVPSAVDRLLPDFATALQPFWAAKGERPFGEELVQHQDAVADALLAVADAKAGESGTAAKVYSGLRPKAKAHVIEALPRLGEVIDGLASRHGA